MNLCQKTAKNRTEHAVNLTIWYQSLTINTHFSLKLTLSGRLVSSGYISKCSCPYWSNPPFLIFLTFGHSQCPNIKKLKGWVRPV